MNNIRTWYKSNFATDELGDSINPKANFKSLAKNFDDVYKYLGVCDSVVRERVFQELSERMHVYYDVIYDFWVGMNNLNNQN